MASRAVETSTPQPSSVNTHNDDSIITSPIVSPALEVRPHKNINSSYPPRLEEPQSVLARRRFPAVVFIVMYNSPDTVSSIRGVFMSLSNANEECRRLGREHGAPGLSSPSEEQIEATAAVRMEAERKRDIGRELERWVDPEGIECWVEAHGVVPRQWLGRESVSSATRPSAPNKLYQNEEEDDEIMDDEEYQGYS